MKRERTPNDEAEVPSLVTLVNDVLVHILFGVRHGDGQIETMREIAQLESLRSVCRCFLITIDEWIVPRLVHRLAPPILCEIKLGRFSKFVALTSLTLTEKTPNAYIRGHLSSLTLLRQLVLDSLLGSPLLTDADIKPLTQLTHLSISNLCGCIHNAALAPLVNLTSLKLGRNPNITDVGIAHLSRLTSLDLRGNRRITDAALRNLTALTRLGLSRVSPITDSGLAPLERLRKLVTWSSESITDAGLSSLTALTSLVVPGNENITGGVISRLVNLTRLDVRDSVNPINDAHLLCLTALTKLAIGGVSHTKEDDENTDGGGGGGVVTDLSITRLSRLRQLILVSGNHVVTDDGLSQLTTLTRLDLTDNREISNCGIDSLTALTILNLCRTSRIHSLNHAMTRLRELNVSDSAVDSESVSPLTTLTTLHARSHSTEAIAEMHLERMTSLIRLIVEEPCRLPASLCDAIIARGGCVASVTRTFGL